MTDSELLSAHLRGDAHAFATLVQRHVDLVHGVAVRQAPASADDVAQAVFLLLNQKALHLKNRTSVAGWLFRTAHLCARNVRRAEARRKSHEREAAMHYSPKDDQGSLLPQLDDAISSLSVADRELILLRHLQNRELAEIAADLGITVPAATKRLQRALDRLRTWFSRRGESVSASGVTSALVAAGSYHAPATLHIAPGAASTTAVALAKSAAVSLATPVFSAIAASAVVVCVAATTAAITGRHHMAASGTTPVSTPASAPALADESAMAGKQMIASFDVLLDTDVADALRAAATEVPSTSKGYTVYRIANSAFSNILRPALDAGQLLPGGHNVNYDGALDPGMSSTSYARFNTQFQGRLQGALLFGLSESGDPQFLSLKWLGDAVDVTANALPFKVSTRDAASNWKQFAGEMSLHTTLSPGESLFLLCDAGTPAGRPLSYLVVWQSFKALPDQADRIRSIDTAAPLIAAGPGGARDLADRFLQWSHDAKPAATLVPEKFSRTFLNGASVRLLALGRPRDVPFCWWSADGASVREDWTGLDVSLEVPEAYVVQWKAPVTAKLPQYPNWYSDGADAMRYYLADHGEVAQPLPAGASSIDIGISAGPWKEVGIMPAADAFEQQDITVEVKQIMPISDGKGAMPVVRYKAPGDTEIRILAADAAGKLYGGNHMPDPTADWPGVHFVLPSPTKSRHLSPNMNIPPANIDHLVIQRRHIDWAHFENFSDEPNRAVLDQANVARAAEIRAQIARQAADERAAKAAEHREEIQKKFHAADPSTPLGTMIAIIVRARAGDLAGTRAFFLTANPSEAAIACKIARYLVAHESLRTAAEKRFGELAADDALLPNDLLEDLDSELDVKWTIEGDRASNGGGVMRKHDGRWLIDTAPLIAGSGSLVNQTPIFEQIHQRLDRGDFPTAAAAAKALQEALKPPAPAAAQPIK